MPYPSPKVHRVARRRLGRGQYPRPVPVISQVMGTGSTVTILFSAPVLVKGPIGFHVPGRTAISQAQTTPTAIVIVLNAPLWSLAYTLDNPPANLASMNGSAILGTSGTFPPTPLPPTTILLSAHDNGDGSVTLIWNQPVIWMNNGFGIAGLLLWFPSESAWRPPLQIGTGNSATQPVATSTILPATKIVVEDQLYFVTSAHPFAIATPIAPIT